MANCYSDIVADKMLPVSLGTYRKLKAALEAHDDSDPDECHGMKFEFYAVSGAQGLIIAEMDDAQMGDLHCFSEESGNLDAFPDSVLEIIGEILKSLDMPYWEFGIAYTTSRKRPGEFGGGQARIYQDGSIEYASYFWKADLTSDQKLARALEGDLLTILEAAREALSDVDTFDVLAERLDLSDDEMQRVRARLFETLSKEVL